MDEKPTIGSFESDISTFDMQIQYAWRDSLKKNS